MATRKAAEPKIPEALLERVRKRRKVERRGRRSGKDWTGEYGYGAGRAHPSVEFAACPQCGQPPGKLCIGDYGPKMGIHYLRSRSYRAMLRAAAAQLDGDVEQRQGRRNSRKGVLVQVIK